MDKIEEEANQLRQENAERKEAIAWRDRRIEELEGLLMSAVLQIEELERRLAKDSHNRSKPPASAGLKRKGHPHKKRGKSSGGHLGHQGHALQQAATPDQGITHRPTHCEVYSASLAEVAGQFKERRQIHELSVLRLVVPEH
ncbi:MAG TPA: DUF6444 domain-containing protein [Ktedonobacteraceae bacterium]|nr:DUF6444 domain-containing protein [Ktedonobacteraceae bacterium]